MPPWSHFENRDRILPEDLDPLRPTVVIIETFDTEEYADKQTGEIKQRHKIWFYGWKYPMRMYDAQVKVLKALFPRGSEDAMGQPLALLRDTYTNYGNTLPCVKIMPAVPVGATPTCPPAHLVERQPARVERALRVGVPMSPQSPAAQLGAAGARATQRDETPIGEVGAQRFLAKARTLGGGYDGFLRRLQRRNSADHDAIVGRDIQDLPRWVLSDMKAYLEDLEDLRAESSGSPPATPAASLTQVRELPAAERASVVAEAVPGVRRGVSPVAAAAEAEQINDPDIPF